MARDPAANPPAIWFEFSERFHQDFCLLYPNGTDDIVSDWSTNKKKELLDFVCELLDSEAGEGDLKRIWNKTVTDWSAPKMRPFLIGLRKSLKN